MRPAALLLALALPIAAAAQAPDYSPPRVRLMDGTAALPALTFTLDPDTGIYRSADNTIVLVTNGAARLTIGPVQVTASGNVTASGFIGVGLFASGEGIARYGLTVNGANESYSTTTPTGGVDLAHTFFTLADFSAADKVLQWGDGTNVELGACFGDGSCQFDGVITSDGTGTSTFAGRLSPADGVDLNTTAAQPTCAVGVRGLLWTVEGGAGVADKVEQCMKGTADTYAWKTIATAP